LHSSFIAVCYTRGFRPEGTITRAEMAVMRLRRRNVLGVRKWLW